MVPHLWFREFIEIIFVEQIDEVSAPVWDHFFECLALLVCIGFSSEIIGVMSAYENGLCEVYCENGLFFLQLLIPLVIGICIG